MVNQTKYLARIMALLKTESTNIVNIIIYDKFCIAHCEVKFDSHPFRF